jgi:integrase
MPIDNSTFARQLNQYILSSREELESKSDSSSEYLIISHKGDPLSQDRIEQLFRDLRKKFPDDLPPNLSAKSLRHTFSCRMEVILRQNGMDEERRRQALALLRGDSNLDSQNVYIAQEIEEQARVALKNYHRKLLENEA